MKMFRKLTAMLLAFGMVAAAAQMCSAAVVSDKYINTYIENFDDAETVFGDDGLIVYGQNATETNVTVTADTAQGGNYLKIASGGKDVQVVTKKGIFKHDVTVVDMNIRAQFNSNFPLVNLINNGAKMGSQSNGIVRFVNSASELRAYNIETGTNTATTGGNEWKQVRIILDSINNTVTTKINGTQASVVANIATEWDNANLQLNFQVALNSSLMIDDLVVSDGKYMSDVFVDQNFEHSSTMGATGDNFFYGVRKVQNPTVIYDATEENSYIDIANAAGNTIYTNPFNFSANKPLVVEFRLKTDATSNGKIFFRQSSSIVPTMFEIKNGVITGPNKTKTLTDGKFHTYRVVFTAKEGTGYTATLTAGGEWIGTLNSSSNTYAGTAMDLRFNVNANSTMAIDDLKIYYPQEPMLFSDLDGKTDVAIDSLVEIVSNTQINASSAKNATITANGEKVTFTTSSSAEKNSYIFNIDGGLQYGTTYVITTGANGVKDMFEQYYNDTITFTTVENTTPPTPPQEDEEEQGEISCTINGAEVTDSTLVTGMMLATFNVDASIGATARGYIAHYDNLGNLSGVTSVPVETSGDNGYFKRATFNVTNDMNKVKLFIWDEEYEPVCAATELVRAANN